jgi:hypothetical protein
VTLLSAAIRALGSPLGPHLESDLEIDLYSGSTPIANMDRSGCQISFNSLNKSIISLSAAIGALGSPLGPHLKSDLETDLYYSSTPIAIKTSPIAGSVLDDLKKLQHRYRYILCLSLAAQYDEMGSSDFSDLLKSLNT